MTALKNSVPWLLALVLSAPLAAQQSIPLDIVPQYPVEIEAIADQPAAPPDTGITTGSPEAMEPTPGGSANVEVGSVQADSVLITAQV